MLTGIILAGGDQLRMRGDNKALLPFAGEKLIHKQLREMRKICGELIVVTDNPRPFLRVLDTEVRIITDYIGGKGVLGGLHAGLSLMNAETGWVVGCDMPFISAEAAEQMLLYKEQYALEAVVPQIEGRVELLHGIYDRSVTDKIRMIAGVDNPKPELLLHYIQWSDMDADQFLVVNIDTRFVEAIKTPDDYERMQTECL